jgi:tol-pal system-associated acyl-CoA thioesterase
VTQQFELPVRVYWADTDAGGVVYHSNYLDYCERARTEWLRQLGFSQQRLAESEGVLFTVARLAIEYHRPARLDDLLQVRSRIELAGGASVEFNQEIWRDAPAADLLASVNVKVACVDAASFRPRRLPASLREEFR